MYQSWVSFANLQESDFVRLRGLIFSADMKWKYNGAISKSAARNIGCLYCSRHVFVDRVYITCLV